MKNSAVIFAVLLLQVPAGRAADVRLESLKAFDSSTHKISVSIQSEVKGGCLPGTGGLESVYRHMLESRGFMIAAFEESDLEFAVSVKGFSTSGAQSCGLSLLSMARQVPLRKILRLSPGSNSTRYRLWTAETLVTGTKSDIPALVLEQARKDVISFHDVIRRAQN